MSLARNATQTDVDEADLLRFAAIDSYAVLDSAPEPSYDDIVALATQICETPVAIVSLVARDRQWFKAKAGLEVCETPLDASVCAHALRERGMLVIPDLTKDPRTRANPLVIGEPKIRFYAGAVLETPEGVPIGTLCVLDRKPRPKGLRPEQASALQALARQVMSQLELRRLAQAEAQARRSLQAGNARYRAILESAVDYAIVVLDRDGLVTDWNEGATRILGWTPEEVVGRPLDAFFLPEDVEAGVPQAERVSALTQGRGIDERWHRRKSGETFWANGETMPLVSDSGDLEGYIKILRDRTAQQLTEKRLRDNDERLEMLFDVSGALRLVGLGRQGRPHRGERAVRADVFRRSGARCDGCADRGIRQRHPSRGPQPGRGKGLTRAGGGRGVCRRVPAAERRRGDAMGDGARALLHR